MFVGGPAVMQYSGSTTSPGWTSHIGPVLQRDRSDKISEFLPSEYIAPDHFIRAFYNDTSSVMGGRM